MSSRKQIKANRKNAKKGGVKTKAGKEISKYNNLRHGLLCQATIITKGDGKEDPAEFDALLIGLIDCCKPKGFIEEMLVEKVAVSYWRLRRAARFETGIMRKKLDTFKDDLLEGERNLGDIMIENSYRDPKVIEDELKEILRYKKEIKPRLKPLEKLIVDLERPDKSKSWQTGKINKFFNSSNKDMQKALQKFSKSSKAARLKKMRDFKLSLENILDNIDSKIITLGKELHRSICIYDRAPLLGWESAEKELELLIKYETAIERAWYQALNQLDRIQRTRRGR